MLPPVCSYQSFLEKLPPGLVGDAPGALLTPEGARRAWEEGDENVVEDISRCVALQAFMRRRRKKIEENSVLAPFNPTPDSTIEAAVDLLEIRPSDVVYDIGCGDGRFVAAAARRRPRKSVGIELDGELARRAQKRIEGLSNASILHADALDCCIEDATKLFLYLVPSGMNKLLPTLRKLRDKHQLTQIVAYTFSIPEEEEEEGNGSSCFFSCSRRIVVSSAAQPLFVYDLTVKPSSPC